MNDKVELEGKRILLADDEPDVLQTLEEILDMCSLDPASDFDTAERFLNENEYDAAILDIMGIRGFDLLKLCNEKSVPAIMLTAHAHGPNFLRKSVKEGASAYVPKDKMGDIALYLWGILKAEKNHMESMGLGLRV